MNGDMNETEVENPTINVLGLHLVRNTYVHQEKKSSRHCCKNRCHYQAVNIVNNPSGFSGATRMYKKYAHKSLPV